jgi:hypothetical protein
MIDHRKLAMLEHHLFHNHYPSPDRELFPYIKRALELGPTKDFVTVQVGEELRTLEQHGFPVTARELIQQFHLDMFVDDQEEEHDA